MRMRTTTFALVATAALLACGPRGEDKLGDDEIGGNSGSGNAEAVADSRCEAQVVQDEVRRQLFARAAEIRGSNVDNYARVSGFTVLQMEGVAPVAAASASEAVDCRGHATLRLPAGLRVAGGRTVIGGDIDYSVSAGSRSIVALGRSDAITVPLATLTQSRPAAGPDAPAVESLPTPQAEIPAPEPRPVTVDRPPPPERRQVTVDRAPPPPPRPEPRTVTPTAARPSFNCRSARTRGERAVCADDGLAALDREMASQYRSAVANGSPAQRRLLSETRDRFLGFRDRCGSDSCIASAYRGRMREIDDIAAGRWRGDR